MMAATTLQVHPIAERIPAMTGAEYIDLRDDIAANGLRQPIVMYEGQILDGRHRYRVCEEIGVAARFEEYEGDEPASYVCSLNLKRRHLTKSQLSVVGLEMLPDLEIEARGRMAAGGAASRKGAQTRAPLSEPARRATTDAGSVVGVSSRQIQAAKTIGKYAPELLEPIKNGEISIHRAEEKVAEMRERSGEGAHDRLAGTGGSRRGSGSKGRMPPVESPEHLSTRGQNIATKNRDRIHKGLSTLEGLVDGLVQLDLTNVHHVSHPDEIVHWHRQIAHAMDALRHFRTGLKEARL